MIGCEDQLNITIIIVYAFFCAGLTYYCDGFIHFKFSDID